MGVYLTPEAIKWSMRQLAFLPNDQSALFFFLIFARCCTVDVSNPSKRVSFEEEFRRYFGGAIKGGGWAAYDPFSGKWRADNYINSTVYGRLINGSHWWTEGKEALFKREPTKGWPAKFTLTDEGFDNLLYRDRPPYLKSRARLPIHAVSIYYFKYENLSAFGLSSLDELRKKYENLVISKHSRLKDLFIRKLPPTKVLFRNQSLSEEEKLALYPPSPYCSETKKQVLLYEDDLKYIRSKLPPGKTPADFIRELIRGIL